MVIFGISSDFNNPRIPIFYKMGRFKDNKIDTYIKNEVLIRPTKLIDELSYDNALFNHRSEYETIIEYIEEFLEGRNINRYLVLPGIRDVGKSTILFQIYEYLL